MKKFNPKLIMIDVDGTLVDSVPDLAYCVDELMVAMDREKWGEAKVRHWVGNGVPKLVERSLTGELEGTVDKADFDKAYPIFLDLYAVNTSGRSSLYDGVREGLDYMKAQGYTLGCVTNKAEQLSIQTALGASMMASNSEDSARELRAKVTSPNGTTQAAIESFQDQNFEMLVSHAMRAAFDRAREMGVELGDDD